MLSLFLTFSDPKLEEEYKKDCQLVKFLNFYKFILLEMGLAFVILIFNLIYDRFTYGRLSLLAVIVLVSFFIYFFSKKYQSWKYLNALLVFIHLSLILVTIELISLSRETFSLVKFQLTALIYSTPLQVLFCSIIITRLKWSFTVPFYAIFQIFFVARIYSFKEMFEIPLIILTHILCVLAFSSMAYYQETSTRAFYSLINESNKRLINFEILLNNIIPTPIIILDIGRKSSEFTNVSAINFLENNGISTKETVFPAVERLLTKFRSIDQRKEIPKLDLLFKNSLNDSEKMEFYIIEANLLRENPGLDRSETGYFQLKFLKLSWNSKPCILLVIDDITESHRIEELRNLDEYKNQLLATVSHDLRTPLNGMLGMMELVSLNLEGKKDKKNMNIAMRSGHLLLNMINDILDFSQINNKKLRLNLSNVNLIDILKETSKLLRFQAKSKGLQFILKIKENEATINSDSNRIRQILLNLLNNALKFTPSGFIQLSLKKRFDSEFLGFIYKIKVKDTGIGIREEDRPKLFKLFGKLDLENPEINSSGVGLGLTISQNLAKMLSPNLQNSGIHLTSLYGKGSKFWFFLEGEKNDDELFPEFSPECEFRKKNIPYIFLNSQEDPFEKNQRTYYKEKVLIVDDDMVNLMVAKRYCEFYEVEFLTANNGAEAIAIFENLFRSSSEKEYEIKGILMDCNMPIIDGYNATKRILDLIRTEEREEMPIIGMTANVLHEDLQNCLRCGMKSFLCKPVSRNDFGMVLQNNFKMKMKMLN